MAAVPSKMKLVTTQAAILLVQRAVPAMPALVPRTALTANAVLKRRRPVKGRDVGHRGLFAAATAASKLVTVHKSVVQTAACPLIRGIRVVGSNIAKMEIFVALEISYVVPMDGSAVETLV
jgi:hypothetical protein